MAAAVVGFKLGINQRDRTPAAPCLFAADYCNPGDYANWLKHAEQWMFAVLSRMKTPAMLRSMKPMVERLASLKRTDISWLERFQLTADTKALVNMCVDLKNVADALGEPVQVGEVTRDLSRPMVELPIPSGLKEIVGWDWSFDKFLADLTGGITDILRAEWMKKSMPWILLGVAGLLIANQGRKGKFPW